MEKIILKNYNLQKFIETDWKPVDGETKIYEISSFDFSTSNDLDGELDRIYTKFIQNKLVNSYWQLSKEIRVILPNYSITSSDAKHLIEKNFPKRRYFWERIIYQFTDTTALELKDFFTENIIFTVNNFDLSEQLASFLSLNSANLFSTNVKSENLQILKFFARVSKTVSLASSKNLYYIKNISIIRKSVNPAPQQNITFTFDINKILEKLRKPIIYFFNLFILSLLNEYNKYILENTINETIITNFDNKKIILPHVNLYEYNFKRAPLLNIKLKAPLRFSNCCNVKIPIYLPKEINESNVEFINDTINILYDNYKIEKSSVDVTNLIIDRSETSLRLIKILKDNDVKMTFDKNNEKSVTDEKSNEIIRLFIDPSIYSSKILEPPTIDDSFYVELQRKPTLKKIYYKILNDFIFSICTVENTYFDKEISYKSIFNETKQIRRLFLMKNELFSDDNKLSKDQIKIFKKIPKTIRDILKLNFFKMQEHDPLLRFNISLLEISVNYNKHLKDLIKNGIKDNSYLPKIKEIQDYVIKNFLNNFYKVEMTYEITIDNDYNFHKDHLKLLLIFKSNIQKYQEILTKNKMRGSKIQIEDQLKKKMKDFRIIFNFQKDNFDNNNFFALEQYIKTIKKSHQLYNLFTEVKTININFKNTDIEYFFLIILTEIEYKYKSICLYQVINKIKYLVDKVKSSYYNLTTELTTEQKIDLAKDLIREFNLYEFANLNFINNRDNEFIIASNNNLDKDIDDHIKKILEDETLNVFQKQCILQFSKIILKSLTKQFFVYNFNFDKLNSSDINNILDKFQAKFNNLLSPINKCVLKFDNLENFYPLYKLLAKYNFPEFKDVMYTVNGGRDFMNLEKYFSVEKEFTRKCYKIYRKNPNVDEFNKTIRNLNTTLRRYSIYLPSVKKDIIKQIIYNTNFKNIDLYNDEFYRDIWYQTITDQNTILIELSGDLRIKIVISDDSKITYIEPQFININDLYFEKNKPETIKHLNLLKNEIDYEGKEYYIQKNESSLIKFKIIHILNKADNYRIYRKIQDEILNSKSMETFLEITKLNLLRWSYTDSVGIDEGGPNRLSIEKISEEIGNHLMEPIKFNEKKCLFLNFKKNNAEIDLKYGDKTNLYEFLGKLISKCLLTNNTISISLDPLIYFIIIKSFNYILNNEYVYNNVLEGKFFNKKEESTIFLNSMIRDDLLKNIDNYINFLDIELEIYDENLFDKCIHYSYLKRLFKMNQQEYEFNNEDDDQNLLVERETTGEIKRIYPYQFDDSFYRTPPYKSQKNCLVDGKNESGQDIKIKNKDICKDEKIEITYDKLIEDESQVSKFKTEKTKAIIPLDFCGPLGICQEQPMKTIRMKLNSDNRKIYNKFKQAAYDKVTKKYNWNDDGKNKKIKDYFEYMLDGDRLNSICSFTYGFLYNIFNLNSRIGRKHRYQEELLEKFKTLTVRDLDTLITGTKNISIDKFINNMIIKGDLYDDPFSQHLFEEIKNKVRQESEKDKNYLNLLHKIFLDSWNVPISGFVLPLKLKFYSTSNRRTDILRITGKNDYNDVTIEEINNIVVSPTEIHSCFGSGDVYVNDKTKILYNNTSSEEEKKRIFENDKLIKNNLDFFSLEKIKSYVSKFKDNPYNVA